MPAGFAGEGAGPPRARRRTNPEASLETLAGVGPKVAERLERLGLRTVRDLAEHIPRAYLDWEQVASFGDLSAGEEATVRCTLERVRVRPTRRRNLKIVEGKVVDAAGVRETAIWFNQAYLAKLEPGTELLLHGTRELGGGFRVARTEVRGTGLHTVGLVAEYRASEEVPSFRLRSYVETALPRVRFFPDPLPARTRHDEGLPLRADALVAAHRPRDRSEAETARERLAFEELLALQLGFQERRRALAATTNAPALPEDGDLIERYRAVLPFTLTPEQEKAIREIGHDLAGQKPMQRLLQGDVGSGKTVVALYALLRAVEAGQQGALMAPTETLAEQHFLTVEGICNELGVRCELLTSSVPAAQRRAVRDRLASGETDLAVGTHALIQEEVEFRSLAVAVVDEQHRFGVEQRSLLGGRGVHTLHMTATPIPRTLAQTVFGDLDVTEIARPPANRKPVVTSWVGHERSSAAYTRLRRHLEEGRQAYVVCPLVSESETIEARAAEQEAERLREHELRGFRVGVLHGKLKTAERREVMDAFKRRELDVLVATTVIEVGVDVPNATIMIVQEADRFGLAQLHQLRGRVGRGAEQSYCLLVSRPKEELTEEAVRRLEALVETSDGFALAEVDLELRGEGQLLGVRQSGLSDLKFARLVRDRQLIAKAQTWAERLVDEDPAVLDPLGREAERVESNRGFA
ncbi:MAG TPA: ATP-dependent DNA helicase RecG [Gaiellaceae bacterium]|nr:ATP-dependent DNA helicase RecG [Gaiellaceae bacterium]